MNQTTTLSQRNIISMKSLTADDINTILDTADSFKEISTRAIKKVPTLRGRTIINLFFEPSTRTRTSFEIAGKRLSADVINISGSASSTVKGESLIDTVKNLEAMNPDILVVRHNCSGAPALITQYINRPVINAGDGTHEHPSQSLLDLLTIREHKGGLKGLKVTIVGDITHSRVARSNIEILQKLGSKINVIGPKKLIPNDINRINVKVFTNMKEGLKNCDIVMMLRIQKERIVGKILQNEKEYFNKFGLNYIKLAYAKKNAFVMHPGPMNRGVEIDSKLADDVTRSLIQEQVSMGVAIRMACLEILINNKDLYGI